MATNHHFYVRYRTRLYVGTKTMTMYILHGHTFIHRRRRYRCRRRGRRRSIATPLLMACNNAALDIHKSEPACRPTPPTTTIIIFVQQDTSASSGSGPQRLSQVLGSLELLCPSSSRVPEKLSSSLSSSHVPEELSSSLSSSHVPEELSSSLSSSRVPEELSRRPSQVLMSELAAGLRRSQRGQDCIGGGGGGIGIASSAVG